MKKFKIAYLYYDLMNLYGENGNIRYLEKKLKEQDIDVQIDLLSIPDKIDYKKYDFYYIGAGSEKNELLVLEDMLKQKEDIIKAINNKKFFLVTGNALELFGKKLVIDGNEYNAINAYGYEVFPEKERIVGEQYYKCDLINHSVIGFQNRYSVINSIGEDIDTLFDVVDGVSYDGGYDVKKEGIKYNNFYGTYLIGPFLVRNPYFTDYLIEDICKSNDVKYRKGKRNGYSYLAYNEYLKNFYEKINS